MRAAEIAELKVLRLINEPTAAAIAYMNRDKDKLNGKTVMIFDLGGGRNTYSIELHNFFSMFSIRGNNCQKNSLQSIPSRFSQKHLSLIYH